MSASESISIKAILSQIEKLDYKARLNVLEKIILLLKKNEIEPYKSKLLDLSGLGSDIWAKVDIDNYLLNERQWD